MKGFFGLSCETINKILQKYFFLAHARKTFFLKKNSFHCIDGFIPSSNECSVPLYHSMTINYQVDLSKLTGDMKLLCSLLDVMNEPFVKVLIIR